MQFLKQICKSCRSHLNERHLLLFHDSEVALSPSLHFNNLVQYGTEIALTDFAETEESELES